MRQVIKHRDIRLLNMIRRTDPVIPFENQENCPLMDAALLILFTF